MNVDLLNKIINTEKYWVYFLSFAEGEILKIGCSNNPIRRYGNLCCENPLHIRPGYFVGLYEFNTKKEALYFETMFKHEYKKHIIILPRKRKYGNDIYLREYFDVDLIFTSLDKEIQNNINKIKGYF